MSWRELSIDVAKKNLSRQITEIRTTAVLFSHPKGKNSLEQVFCF